MNMLKMEENSKYRQTVKNVLEFSPEVLKRFVNFMNNPDEATAVAQFGTGDKYYGVAMMMVTMPGLPMFGHGQIEGLTEKYGMEYRRAYWDEQPDIEMIRRHEREIFPLMRQRFLFSGADNFALFDFVTPDGWVDENVFAYTNRAGGHRALILYNNAYNNTRGKVLTSTAINHGDAEKKHFVHRNLAEALALSTSDRIYYIFRDHRTNLQYLRSGRQIADEGLYAELSGYQYHAFLDFDEVYDADGDWYRLAGRIGGGGVPSMAEAMREMHLEPILMPFTTMINNQEMRKLIEQDKESRERFVHNLSAFMEAAGQFARTEKDLDKIRQRTLNKINAIPLDEDIDYSHPGNEAILDIRSQIGDNYDALHHILICWAIIGEGEQLAIDRTENASPLMTGPLWTTWMLNRRVQAEFAAFWSSDEMAWWDHLLVAVLLKYSNVLQADMADFLDQSLIEMFDDYDVTQYIQANDFEGVVYFNKEQWIRMVHALLYTLAVQELAEGDVDGENLNHAIQTAETLIKSAETVKYRMDKFLELMKEQSIP